MIVVTTPMCKKIVEWAGLTEFKVNKHPDEEEGDLAILLSESKVEMDSLAIKLNSFSQIKESIKKVSDCLFEKGLVESSISNENIDDIFKSYGHLEFASMEEDDFEKIRLNNSNKKVKVYSEFLKDIVLDIGAEIIDFSLSDLETDSDIGEDFSYVVFPDFLKGVVSDNENFENDHIKFIEIPTHSNVSKDPIERSEERYVILINGLS